MRLESDFLIVPNLPEIQKTTMTPQFADIKLLSNFFNIILFLLSSLVTDPSFMSM